MPHFSDEITIAEPAWAPTYIFFYGSLMDSTTLCNILGVSTDPIMHPAKLSGYHMKMWGPYPAIIKSSAAHEIDGMLFRLDKQSQFDKLAEYETEAYTWAQVDVDVEVGDGRTQAVSARVFVWAGSLKQLRDGRFDLEKFQIARGYKTASV